VRQLVIKVLNIIEARRNHEVNSLCWRWLEQCSPL